MNAYTTARDARDSAVSRLLAQFPGMTTGAADAVFSDSSETLVAGVAGLAFRAPVMTELFSDPAFSRFALGLFRAGKSLLVTAGQDGTPTFHAAHGSSIEELKPEAPVAA
ncbi:MAG TPA: hypothetical protein PKL75_02275, partial [Treponemataceae bacterium]|nr:hypothetical protein [Treponemataceae bacterium]